MLLSDYRSCSRVVATSCEDNFQQAHYFSNLGLCLADLKWRLSADEYIITQNKTPISEGRHIACPKIEANILADCWQTSLSLGETMSAIIPIWFTIDHPVKDEIDHPTFCEETHCATMFLSSQCSMRSPVVTARLSFSRHS
jgi:hypothetical protein